MWQKNMSTLWQQHWNPETLCMSQVASCTTLPAVSPPEEKDDNLSQLSGQGEKSSSCEEQEDVETEEQQARGMGSLTLAQPLTWHLPGASPSLRMVWGAAEQQAGTEDSQEGLMEPAVAAANQKDDKIKDPTRRMVMMMEPIIEWVMKISTWRL